MNVITKLKEEIQAIEDQAGQLDEKDYEALYKLLAVAYFKAKDVIELLEGENPIIDDSAALKEELIQANQEIIDLNTKCDHANGSIDRIIEIVAPGLL